MSPVKAPHFVPTLNRIEEMNGKLVVVDMPYVRLWFSYDTLVAFSIPFHHSRPIVHENIWSATTGRHLNYIDGGHSRTKEGRDIVASRLSAERFARYLEEALR